MLSAYKGNIANIKADFVNTNNGHKVRNKLGAIISGSHK